MSRETKSVCASPNPVYVQLYKRFYSNGNAVIDTSASSHWQKYTQYFKVLQIDETQFDLAGYGFGSSGSNNLIARFLAFAVNTLHLASLGMPDLRLDVRMAKRVVQSMGLAFSNDAFRQVCTLNLLDRYMKSNASRPKRILIIGDGHGIFSALFHTRYPDARIFLADLGSVLFFQA